MTPEHAHVMNCEKDTCPVCHSKLVEYKQYWDWVWFTIVTNKQNTENHSLNEY